MCVACLPTVLRLLMLHHYIIIVLAAFSGICVSLLGGGLPAATAIGALNAVVATGDEGQAAFLGVAPLSRLRRIQTDMTHTRRLCVVVIVQMVV